MKFLREYLVTNVKHALAYFNDERDALEYADQCRKMNRYDTITVYKRLNESPKPLTQADFTEGGVK